MAAQYYRDHLKLKVSNGDSGKKGGLIMQQPDYEKGRARYAGHMKITR